MFTNANEIIEIIEARKNRGYGFQHFVEYMESLGNPQNTLKSIHVAGTNGKGSCVHYLASMLQVANYRVGTFTSPYLITHLDRIRINDEYISEEDFVNITNEYYASWIAWDLSMFEIDMCIAVVYFVRKKVDYCIFEVGLGGRLDFTNIIIPLVSLITNIGKDHMELLGDTYEKIAREKAGIIKQNIDVITSEKKASCLRIFEEIALEHNAHCIRVLPYKDVVCTQTSLSFTYPPFVQISLSTPALYQCQNASLAIACIQYLNEYKSFHVDEVAIREGLSKANWLGRFEIIQEHPKVILDGAHNSEGIEALCASLHNIQNPKIIFSVLKDKNFEKMLTLLQAVSDDITICQLQNSRALDIHELRKRKGCFIEKDYRIALTKALRNERPIIITGSLYFISEVRKYMKNLQAESKV
ncbi:MAG: folylpolyglutamate synthase/dihydrofolate synthase family protein [Longicatena sp.]